MKVYVSGRIKDYVEYREHFDFGAKIITDAGHEAINPCELGHPEMSYEEFMRVDLQALLDCGAIFMLKGWERSVGARTEHLVASVCGLECWYEDGLVGLR